MTPIFRSRLEAEELQSALDGEVSPEVESRHRELLATVALLSGHRPVSPRPAFLTDLREQLLLAAETDLVAAPAAPRRTPDTQGTTRRRVGTLAASLVIVGGTAGMAAAAQGALPGDPLYPLKRGAEQVETGLRLSEASQGRAELRHAESRLAEAVELQASGAPTDQVVAAVEAFRATSESGAGRLFTAYAAESDPADVRVVRDFTAAQLDGLATMGADDEPALEPALLDAADTLASLDQQARTLCASCGETPVWETPESLSSAASAASLDVLLARPAEQASLDAGALADLDRAQVAALVRQAEEAAADPALPSGNDWPVATRPDAARTPVDTELVRAGRPLTSTVRETTRAVDDLVTGLGDAAGSITRGVREGTRTDTPLDDTVAGVTDTVDGAVEGVTDVTGSLTGPLSGRPRG